MCPDCPARIHDSEGQAKPCHNGIDDNRICLGDHACENLGEQALKQALQDKKDKAEIKP